MVVKKTRRAPAANTLKGVSGEPQWPQQPQESARQTALITAFNWYNYNFGKKEAKEFLIAYAEKTLDKNTARKIKSIPDREFQTTAGWLARMSAVGLALDTSEQQHLRDFFSGLDTAQAVEPTEDAAAPAASRPNIQDRLRERATDCAGELEGFLDEFLAQADVKLNLNNHKPMAIIRGMNIQPTHIGVVRDAWLARLEEYQAALEGKDSQLAEGYSHLSKLELKQMIKLAELVLADCDSYVQVKKVERKPRAKKKQTPEQVTRRLKYLKEFPELKLASEPVTKLVESTEFWTYDTKRRKLQHWIADSHAGNMTVKNNAILGYDTNLSTAKTLRRPGEQLAELFKGGKPGARKYFKDIKAVESRLNGRFNEHLIILRAW